jgi:uncharacterized repeat protein (TIGR03803 family)
VKSIRVQTAARVAAALVMALLAAAAQAQTYTVLYSFTGPDGANPYAGVTQDAKGNLYGTTYWGGDLNCNGGYGCGTVFKLDTTGKETVQYSFCVASNCTDGASPEAGVIQDSQRNLYGTTVNGGASNSGVVFKLDPMGKETVLHSFCVAHNCTEGGNPSGVIRGAKGNLYGTTSNGGGTGCGNNLGCGTVFKVDTTGKETVLYSFSGAPDGKYPTSGVIQDSKGNLYGTTRLGGTACHPYGGCGTVFKLDPTGKETVMYSFRGRTDGKTPSAGVIQDAQGNLYGTTSEGGDLTCNAPNGCGTIFKLSRTGKKTVLYRFTGGADGAGPNGGLMRDAARNLYGASGGGNGRVFTLTRAGKLTVLYSFTGGVDGASPNGGLIRDAAGNLYGTAMGGGDTACPRLGCGVVFKLTP